jgi:rRNA maturation endonuclease Nob1
MASLFKCHSCNAITDISEKDRRFDNNICSSCGDKLKKKE